MNKTIIAAAGIAVLALVRQYRSGHAQPRTAGYG